MIHFNPFQWTAVSLLSLAALWELVNWLRAPSLRSQRLVRLVIWMAAAVAISDPGLTQRLAGLVGIDRGADLVFYVFVLLFLAVSFYFYSRYLRLQRELTEVVRHVAIREAREGSPRESN